MKTGLILLNVGTPTALTVSAVRKYLWQFFTDSSVVELPLLARYALAALIAYTRAPQSLKLYQKIWTADGSPLLVLSKQLQARMQQALPDFEIVLGMNYGEPTIEGAVRHLKTKQCQKIYLLPLCPQYSQAASQSLIDKAQNAIKRLNYNGSVLTCYDFYDNKNFIAAYVKHIQHYLNNIDFDLLLFSYHSLPAKQVIKRENKNIKCDRLGACPAINEMNRHCYRAQAFATSQAIANGLGLTPAQYRVSFQSRVGRIEWIKPYTDHLLPELARAGYKKIVVACPSFIIDCLETLEEINMRAREQWLSLGGESFHLIPALNDDALWVEALIAMLQDPQLWQATQ